eukprot:GHVU01033584.1.p1 GENE.GHVU01033584.1~~GHVU01033584.1.p1  ORF type:complete len:293 (-),score=36.06 GHVU01033584.1:650-1528(-)
MGLEVELCAAGASSESISGKPGGGIFTILFGKARIVAVAAWLLCVCLSSDFPSLPIFARPLPWSSRRSSGWLGVVVGSSGAGRSCFQPHSPGLHSCCEQGPSDTSPRCVADCSCWLCRPCTMVNRKPGGASPRRGRSRAAKNPQPTQNPQAAAAAARAAAAQAAAARAALAATERERRQAELAEAMQAKAASTAAERVRKAAAAEERRRQLRERREAQQLASGRRAKEGEEEEQQSRSAEDGGDGTRMPPGGRGSAEPTGSATGRGGSFGAGAGDPNLLPPTPLLLLYFPTS